VSKAVLLTLAIFALAWSALGATPTKPPKRHHRAASSAARTPVKRGIKATAATTANAAHRKGKPVRRPSRSFQQVPSPERYKEIQQALASKGYLQGEATGEWGAESVDALKRFQTDQNLMPDGKISSLSLIALGLGPKRLTAKSEPAPQQPGTPAAPALAPNPPLLNQ
jgi:peptidoglycan hydrolase-like protein with peptidoglycan-binding domain